MLNKTNLILSLICMLWLPLNAQNEKHCIISGIVTDNETHEKLVGVNVYLSQNGGGTVTNVKGEFTLEAPLTQQTLVFSYIGYQKHEISISNCDQTEFNIKLQKAETEIDEVQITAQRKFFGNMDYGRSIPSISAKEIENQSVNNASDILHARIPGVWATKTSGAPGDQQKVRIRGQNSFFSSAEPLYIVDGVPVPIVNMSSLGIADLNIHDIENVTVLRDASSTSLYGFQGGNGVVLIDTKKGGSNPGMTFFINHGYHWQAKKYDLMNTPDFLVTLDSAQSILNVPLRQVYPKQTIGLCSHDWQDEIFSPSQSTEYQLSSAGSIKAFSYYISANHLKQEGTVLQSAYRRSTMSSRITWKTSDKLVVDLSYRGSVQNNDNNQNRYLGNPLIYNGITKSPCLPCTPDSLLYDDNNILLHRTFYQNYNQLSDLDLPSDLAEANKHSLNIISHNLSMSTRFQFSKHIHANIMESFMNRPSVYRVKQGYTYLNSNENVLLYNHQMSLSYNNLFGKNQIGLLLAHRHYTDNLFWKVDSMDGSTFILKNSMAAYGKEGSVKRNISSYIFHVSYSYKQTYFISAVANLSKIKEGLYTNYYTLFPSIALSYDLLKQFNVSNDKALNQLKIYSNFGISGNYPLNGLANDLYKSVPYNYSGNSEYGMAIQQLANHKFRHENTQEYEIGAQSRFFYNRFSLDIAFYRKYLEDLILLRAIPYYYGGGKQYLNFGEIAVAGHDIKVVLIPLKSSLVTWEVGINYSHSNSIVNKIFEDQTLKFTNRDILIPDFNIAVGKSIGDIYGYKYLGKMEPEDWTSKDSSFIIVQKEKYLNAESSDTELNEDDKVKLGNSTPDFTANLSSSFKFKNFGFDCIWYAVGGVQKFNSTRAALYMKGVHRDINQFISDTLFSIRTNYIYESDVFIEDASFIRLKQITLSYSFNQAFGKDINLHLSLSLNNLLTFTQYTGYDPEATIFTDNNFSDNAIDRGAYPNPKSFYITLKMEL